MTRGSIREDAAALRERYAAAGKAEKGRLLDGFCAATGYHRKAAVRLLRRAPAERRRSGSRPPQDDRAVREALSAQPGIRAALHLNDRRNRVLIEEEMVDRPCARAVLFGRDRHLP